MNVSTVNCTPIKPQASFGNNDYEKNYSAAKDKMDSFQKNLVESDDIKSPAGIAIAVVASAAGIYAAGKMGGAAIAKVFKSAPEKLEGVLKKGSKFAQEKAQSLTNNVTPGKLNKAKQAAGKVLSKTEELARKGYKKIAYRGIDKNVGNPERANKAFRNIAGAAALTAAAPQVLRKDADGDGVKDIMQKSQNAYTGAQQQVNNLNALGEIITLIS